MNVNDVKTWPPGSLMEFHSTMHSSVGLVVANDGTNVNVIWGAHCKKIFCEYRIVNLNGAHIRRIAD